MEAVEQYKAESDWMALFMQDCLKPAPNSRTPMRKVYLAYLQWCRENGLAPVNSIIFKRSMETIAAIKKMRPDSRTGATNILLDYDVACVVP